MAGLANRIALSPATLTLLPRYAAVAAASWLGSMFLWTTPFLLSAIQKAYGFDSFRVAYVLSAILMSGGAALLASNLMVGRLSIGRMVGLGAVLESAGLFLMSAAHGFGSALVGALVMGFGSGLVMASLPRLAARMPLPERAFGLTGITNTLIASACFAAIPLMISAQGPRAILWLHFGMVVALAPLILNGLRYPAHPTVISAMRGEERGRALWAIASMLGGNLLYSVCMGSYWAYIEPAAANAGLSPAASGAVVSGATVLSLVGPVVAVWMGVRAGRLYPLVLGNLAFGVSAGATLVAGSFASYGGAITLASALITFLPAFSGGVLIRLDPTARAANLSSAIGFLLNGAGPVVGAMMIKAGGMPALALGVTLLGAAGAVLHIWPAWLVDAATGTLIRPFRRAAARGPLHTSHENEGVQL